MCISILPGVVYYNKLNYNIQWGNGMYSKTSKQVSIGTLKALMVDKIADNLLCIAPIASTTQKIADNLTPEISLPLIRTVLLLEMRKLGTLYQCLKRNTGYGEYTYPT